MSSGPDPVKKERLTFATFFPQCENIHLTKDIGMIPYILARDHGYDSLIISYKNGEYPYLYTEVPGVRQVFMKKGLFRIFDRFLTEDPGRASLPVRLLWTLKVAWDALPVLLRHGRRIDVLQLYHFDDKSILVGWIYRLLNPKGIVYLKLDFNSDAVDYYAGHPDRLNDKNSIFYRNAPFDMMSVESQELHEFVTTKHPLLKGFKERIFYLPNGVDTRRLAPHKKAYAEKENILIHTGRIGSYQKATDIVLDVFARVAAKFPGWKLVMTGQMEDAFTAHYEEFLSQNEGLRERIRYTGYIQRREDLLDWYGRSRVLLFPSRYEGFSLATLEAGFLGNVIVGSDLPCVREVTDGGAYGCLCNVGDADCLVRTLESILADGEKLGRISEHSARFIAERFDWAGVCGELDHAIRGRISGSEPR